MRPFHRLPSPAALLVCALLAAGCGRAGSKDVLARVGSVEIKESEFQTKLAEVAPEYQAYVATSQGRKQFLQILVREKLILAAAKDDHVASTDEFRQEIEREKAEQRRRLKEYEEYLLTKLWIDGLRQKGVLGVDDEEARRYLAENPREVRLRHILVEDPSVGEDLLKRLRKGLNFQAAAKQYSLDQETAANGGALPPLLRGEVLPELEDVAFKMKVGELAGLVQSKFGYHIVKKDSERAVPAAEAVERVRKLLEKQKLDRHLAGLQDRHPVEVFDERYK